MSEANSYRVPEDQHGQRIDLFVANAAQISRRHARRLLDQGGVFVNQKRVRIASRSLIEGDKVVLRGLETSSSQKKLDKLFEKNLVAGFSEEDILYRDDYTLILNKPSGMPSQPTKTQVKYHVIEAAKQYFKKNLKQETFDYELVHRLDQETSGLIILAKKGLPLQHLQEEFKNRRVKKKYVALSAITPHSPFFKQKKPKHKKFAVDSPLGSLNPNGQVSIGAPQDKAALTTFQIKFYRHDYQMMALDCYPETGRTHQIRAHLASIELPIVGDKRYNNFPEPQILLEHELVPKRHFLHAHQITISLKPGSEAQTFIAPIPDDMNQVIQLIRS